MSQPTAIVISDSISPQGIRLTTFQTRHWRPIHSEMLTHRQFSRNAGSSRARPSEAIIGQVQTRPWGPLHWGKNEPGMQASQENSNDVKFPNYMLTPLAQFLNVPMEEMDWHHFVMPANIAWHFTAWLAAVCAKSFSEADYHKQIVNRIIEPYTYIDCVISSTSFNNWFALRNHADAQPEIQALAIAMDQARKDSTPKLLQPGEWHLPYVTDDERANYTNTDLLAFSVARCARVSYKAFDGSIDLQKDVELFRRLMVSEPLHASPAEHQATPDECMGHPDNNVWSHPGTHGNLHGWVQYRKLFLNECVPG